MACTDPSLVLGPTREGLLNTRLASTDPASLGSRPSPYAFYVARFNYAGEEYLKSGPSLCFNYAGGMFLPRIIKARYICIILYVQEMDCMLCQQTLLRHAFAVTYVLITRDINLKARSAIMCIRGSRSSCHHLTGLGAIDLTCSEGRIASAHYYLSLFLNLNICTLGVKS